VSGGSIDGSYATSFLLSRGPAPIYKASYDPCLYLEQVVRGFSRYPSTRSGRICGTARGD